MVVLKSGEKHRPKSKTKNYEHCVVNRISFQRFFIPANRFILYFKKNVNKFLIVFMQDTNHTRSIVLPSITEAGEHYLMGVKKSFPFTGIISKIAKLSYISKENFNRVLRAGPFNYYWLRFWLNSLATKIVKPIIFLIIYSLTLYLISQQLTSL